MCARSFGFCRTVSDFELLLPTGEGNDVHHQLSVNIGANKSKSDFTKSNSSTSIVGSDWGTQSSIDRDRLARRAAPNPYLDAIRQEKLNKSTFNRTIFNNRSSGLEMESNQFENFNDDTDVLKALKQGRTREAESRDQGKKLNELNECFYSIFLIWCNVI